MQARIRAIVAKHGLDGQKHWANPLIGVAARLLGKHYFWYWTPGGKRHLWFGR